MVGIVTRRSLQSDWRQVQQESLGQEQLPSSKSMSHGSAGCPGAPPLWHVTFHTTHVLSKPSNCRDAPHKPPMPSDGEDAPSGYPRPCGSATRAQGSGIKTMGERDGQGAGAASSKAKGGKYKAPLQLEGKPA